MSPSSFKWHRKYCLEFHRYHPVEEWKYQQTYSTVCFCATFRRVQLEREAICSGRRCLWNFEKSCKHCLFYFLIVTKIALNSRTQYISKHKFLTQYIIFYLTMIVNYYVRIITSGCFQVFQKAKNTLPAIYARILIVVTSAEKGGNAFRNDLLYNALMTLPLSSFSAWRR